MITNWFGTCALWKLPQRWKSKTLRCFPTAAWKAPVRFPQLRTAPTVAKPNQFLSLHLWGNPDRPIFFNNSPFDSVYIPFTPGILVVAHPLDESLGLIRTAAGARQ